jgi:O-antigen/teichoic acid export membrane protein
MKPLDSRTIAARSVQGSLFTVSASLITMVSGFIRSVLLARLLLPEYFGVVTLAMFFLSLTAQVQRFGLNKAFIHRKDDTPASLATFASLRVGLAVVTVVISLIAAPVLARLYPKQPKLAPVLAVLASLELLSALNAVPQAILRKGLQFRRLAALDVSSSLTMTVVAPIVAWLGGGVWALVAEQVMGTLANTVGLWLYRRPWRPAFGLDKELVHWYFRFGKFVFANANLVFLLDRFDDFWTGTALGATALGLYSRAYEFARYPRRVLAAPILEVFFPVFARLQHDRLRLSKAFYRVCSLITRVGFLAFGAFALVVPEFIRIFLGDKWLSMAFTFQLMLAYTLLDPLVSVCDNLLVAVGQPKVTTRIRLVQILIFIPAVVVLAHLYGINGVALAADLMLVVGLSLLFRKAGQHVDFSPRRMFLVPILALGIGSTATLGFAAHVALPNDWVSLLTKATVVTLVYLGLSLTLEWREYSRNISLLWSHVLSRSVAEGSANDASHYA